MVEKGSTFIHFLTKDINIVTIDGYIFICTFQSLTELAINSSLFLLNCFI